MTTVFTLLIGMLGPGVSTMESAPGMDKLLVYVGTYTQGASKGIYLMRFELSTGKLSSPELAAEAVNPSFLAIQPNHRFLYAVNEVADADGKKAGAVSAFSIHQTTGKLTLLNHQSSGGTGPCH